MQNKDRYGGSLRMRGSRRSDSAEAAIVNREHRIESVIKTLGAYREVSTLRPITTNAGASVS